MAKVLNCGTQFPKGGVYVRSQKKMLRKFKYIYKYIFSGKHTFGQGMCDSGKIWKFRYILNNVYFGNLYLYFKNEISGKYNLVRKRLV